MSTNSSPPSSGGAHAGSDASTIIYNHEPFDSYVDKVRSLLVALFPNQCSESTPIWHINGGSYHRVIGASLSDSGNTSSSESERGDHIVIRVPRPEFSELGREADDEAAVISFLESHSKIPVPSVLKLDLTSDNPLGDPYVIQRMLPGEPLCDVYPSMTFEEKSEIVKEVVKLMGQLCGITFESIGYLNAKTKKDPSSGLSVGPFHVLVDDSKPGSSPTPVAIDISSFLDIQVAHILQTANDETYTYPNLDKFASTFRDKLLPKLQTLSPQITLYHGDFSPQNILVSRSSDGESLSWKVSGLLDWDGSCALPAPMAYSYPDFLWNWDSDWNEPDPYHHHHHHHHTLSAHSSRAHFNPYSHSLHTPAYSRPGSPHSHLHSRPGTPSHSHLHLHLHTPSHSRSHLNLLEPLGDEGKLLKELFVKEIKAVVPDFVDIVERKESMDLKEMGWLLIWGFRSREEGDEGDAILERLGVIGK
ncbi:hypothetical protein JAAARDRAFT_31487 [Jaapia argillacea MUCL 33604]|uniref:Aminoglycoside phosphotransferase domain-containing protein n=1 Tax=Jaapia argillacea MUCL 33604 TaxID=933084 RepID=A0A067QET9_9AGAM|nr:hypothetical protein JAAARDRAFT_31487 [Jaapia argillacea MUCL 33604]